MKKIVSLLMVLVLCLTMTAPAFATDFVESIPEKPAPEIVPVITPDGKEANAVLLNASGEIIDYVYKDCLVITPVALAKISPLIPDAAEKLLLEVYEKLSNGSMQLPYKKFNAGLNPDDMVIRDLFDASWLCEPCPEKVAEPEITVQVKFDLGVDADTDVYVMSYKHEAWNPIISAVNNGDGTVTCTFEDFCPISFSVKSGSGDDVYTGDNTVILPWVLLLVVSTVMLAVLLISRRKARQ